MFSESGEQVTERVCWLLNLMLKCVMFEPQPQGPDQFWWGGMPQACSKAGHHTDQAFSLSH